MTKDKKFKFYLRHGIVLDKTTESILTPYKEPLDKVEQGFGYYGTLAQNKTGSHVQCHICGYFYKLLGPHIKAVHKVTSSQYRDMFQLSRGRGLVSEQQRVKRINSALSVSKKVKEKRLKNFKSMQFKTRSNKSKYNNSTIFKKSLEQKNREGRCPNQLLDKIEKLATKLKRTPTRRDFVKEYGDGYWGSIRQTFGTWNQALSFTGLTPNSYRPSLPRYTRETTIAMIRNFHEIEGRVPRVSDMGNGIPTAHVIRRLFGGIIEARKAAGFGQNDYLNEN